MIRLGKYQLCVLDLVTDARTGRLSASKIWQSIGFSAMTYSLLDSDMTADVILAYGAVVGGSHVAITFLKRRYPVADSADDPAERSRRRTRRADADVE